MKKTLLLGVCFLATSWYGYGKTDSVFHLNSVHLSQRIHQQKEANPDLKLAPTKLLELRTASVLSNLTYFNGVNVQKITTQFKPVIRGARNQRVSVRQNGIRIEGQDWGADHGLDLNEANLHQIRLMSHTSTLLYESDGVNGMLLVEKNARYSALKWHTKVGYNSINDGVNVSASWHKKVGDFHISTGLEHQSTADLKVPNTTFRYLTVILPIEEKRLKNTASTSQDFSMAIGFDGPKNAKWDLISEFSHDKIGFFASAHGVPSRLRGIQDGDYYGIDLPYQQVTHWLETLHFKSLLYGGIFNSTLSFQHNKRVEFSKFNTHYPIENLVPTDLETALTLSSFIGEIQWKKGDSKWNFQSAYYRNLSEGYGFFLPNYQRNFNALATVYAWDFSNLIHLDLGARLEHQWIDIAPFYDSNVQRYLEKLNWQKDDIEEKAQRSLATNRHFFIHSLSAHLKAHPTENQLIGVHVANTSRVPHIVELAADGVHHGAFRYEKGNPQLSTENAYKVNFYWQWLLPRWSFEASAFADFYTNYIYINPSGIWAYLPDVGQEYHYQQGRALIRGIELESDFHLENWSAQTKLEWLVQKRFEGDGQPYLPFSPPTKISHSLEYIFPEKWLHLKLTYDLILTQNNLATGEKITPSYQLLNASIYGTFNPHWEWKIESNNLFNETYFDHLSYYRTIDVAEAGFNFNLSIQYQI